MDDQNAQGRSRRAETAPKPDLEALYHRKPLLPPTGGVQDTDSATYEYAPPPKFGGAKTSEPEETAQPPVLQPVYGKPPVLRTEQITPLPSGQRDPYYQVEEKQAPPRQKKKRSKALVVLLSLLCVAVAALAITLLREPIRKLFEEAPAQTAIPAPVAAYDEAADITIRPAVEKVIDDIARGVPMELFAATDDRVVTRAEVGGGLYDYYLFSGKGALLGYFENMRPDQVAVLENELLYVGESPYLYDANGRALLDMSNYRHLLDSEPVIGPLRNGWARLCDATGSKYNYVSVQGELIGTLWFSRAFPFTGEKTLAYVDTGASEAIGDRYYLYLLDRSGASTMLRRCRSTGDVVFSAMDYVLWDTGALCALEQPEAALMNARAVVGYMDCGILAAQDAQTGKWGLYQDGKLIYACQYDEIQPVSSDRAWLSCQEGAFTLCALAPAACPPPLTYYFTFTQGEQRDVVGFTVTSRYYHPIESIELIKQTEDTTR